MKSTPNLTESKELEILNRISITLSRSLDLDTVLDIAMDETMRALRVNNGGIYLYDPTQKKLILRVQHNMTDAFIKAKSVVGAGEGCTGTAYNTKEIFSGYGTPEKVYICADAQELMGIDCLAAAPIIFKNEVLGVLELFAPVDRKLTKQEITLLNSICSQIGVTVANANSHQALKHALKDSKLLLEASAAIASSLKLEEILERLINLASELTHISRVAIWLYSEKKRQLVLSRDFESLPAGFSLRIDDLRGPIGQAVRESRTLTVDDFSKTTERIQEISSQFSIKSLLAVPLIFHSRVVGMLTLDKPGIKHAFTEEEIDLSEGIARQAAIAIENAHAFEEQRAIAETLQKSFLPVETPKAPGIDIGVGYVSASLGALVGGDFYDFINLGDRLGFIVGDVSGKGVEAATLTGIVKNTVRVLAIEGLSPGELVAKTNNLITRQIEKNQFVTLFYGLLEPMTGNLVYTNAGHPPALLYDARQKNVEYLSSQNPPIGIFSEQAFNENTTKLKQDGCLLIYTDGVTEARHNNDLFGEQRLEKLFLKNSECNAEQLAARILRKINEFNDGNLADDIAVMVLRKKGRI